MKGFSWMLSLVVSIISLALFCWSFYWSYQISSKGFREKISAVTVTPLPSDGIHGERYTVRLRISNNRGGLVEYDSVQIDPQQVGLIIDRYRLEGIYAVRSEDFSIPADWRSIWLFPAMCFLGFVCFGLIALRGRARSTTSSLVGTLLLTGLFLCFLYGHLGDAFEIKRYVVMQSINDSHGRR